MSALSQASCQSPNFERGGGRVAPRGGHVGITICEKSPAKAAEAMVTDKSQEVAELCPTALAIAELARLFRCGGESFFLKEKSCQMI